MKRTNKVTNSSAERKRILYVEDDEDQFELVSLTLTGYRLIWARDFAEGLRLARQRYFDLYILDNWLPDGTGVELCRLIREFDPHTPVIFLSAAAYEHDVREALVAGAHIYLTKPSDLNELEWTVAGLSLAASAMAHEARLAELAAVREEMAIRSRENARQFEAANGKRLRAEEKMLRAKAKLAFLAAKGTRGDFARLWPSVYSGEIRNRYDDGE